MIDHVICWLNQNEGVAAWVQTIGSLLALGIAIAIPVVQHRREDAKAVRAEIVRRYTQINFVWSTVGTIIGELQDMLDNIKQEHCVISKQNADQQKAFENVLLSFDAFPIHELHTAPLVTLALEMRRDCHKIVDLILKALSDAEASMTKGTDVDLSTIENQLGQLKKRHKQWSERNSYWFNLVYPTAKKTLISNHLKG